MDVMLKGYVFTHAPLADGRLLCMLQTPTHFISCKCTDHSLVHFAMLRLCREAK